MVCRSITSTPVFCFAYLIEYSVGRSYSIFDAHQLYYFGTIAIKIPVFFFMRLAESRPDFSLNRYELNLLKRICKKHFK